MTRTIASWVCWVRDRDPLRVSAEITVNGIPDGIFYPKLRVFESIDGIAKILFVTKVPFNGKPRVEVTRGPKAILV